MVSDRWHQEPAFAFDSNESSELLYESPASICVNGTPYSGNAEARLDLLPRANIRLYGSFKGVSLEHLMRVHTGQGAEISFSLNGYEIEGFRAGGGGSAEAQELNVKWCPSAEPIIGIIGDTSTLIDGVIFHLFNFVEFQGNRQTAESRESAIQKIQHVDITNGEWDIELRSLFETRKNFKLLREEGGYGLTHIGYARRTNGDAFSGEDLEKILTPLGFLLSFAKGGWNKPVCPVGFDSTGNRVWESWSSPREPWHQPFSWFDHNSPSQLTDLFPKFLEKWADNDWGEAFREVIYWYLNANTSSRGIDAGIILTQAAIERLSFEYAVKDKKLLTADGFKSLRASDKFRLLFSSLKLPLEIPNGTPKLKQLAQNGQVNWIDGPHALTEIRNSLVHPEHKRRGQFSEAYYETWNLGLWYLEMGLLAICEYMGTYGNRLKQRWTGQVENVPWS